MTKLKTIIKMAKFGYKLGYNYYNCNFPLSKRKRKNENFFFFRETNAHTQERGKLGYN